MTIELANSSFIFLNSNYTWSQSNYDDWRFVNQIAQSIENLHNMLDIFTRLKNLL
jgi:hypothetical protein